MITGALGACQPPPAMMVELPSMKAINISLAVLLLGVLPLAGCDNNTPLMKAVMHEDLAEAQALAGQGDVNARNSYGWTALTHAARVGNTELMTLLIEQGAAIDAQDESGATPLIRAATRGHLEAVELLLARGADVNRKDESQSSALHWAANRGHIDIVQALVTAGADLNARNDQGMTPMMAAMDKGHNNIALLLRRSGARG